MIRPSFTTTFRRCVTLGLVVAMSVPLPSIPIAGALSFPLPGKLSVPLSIPVKLPQSLQKKSVTLPDLPQNSSVKKDKEKEKQESPSDAKNDKKDDTFELHQEKKDDSSLPFLPPQANGNGSDEHPVFPTVIHDSGIEQEFSPQFPNVPSPCPDGPWFQMDFWSDAQKQAWQNILNRTDFHCDTSSSSSSSSSSSDMSSSSTSSSSSLSSSSSSSSNSSSSSSSSISSGSSSSSTSSSNNSSSSSSSSSSVSSSSSSSSSVNGVNLVANPSLENDGGNGSPAQWRQGVWGTNNANFSYPVSGQEGAKAASINITQYTDGDAKWYFDDVAVSPNAEYSFSDYYKSTAPTQVLARYSFPDGSFAYAVLGSPGSSNDAWQLFSTNFVTPANVASMTVFHLIQSAGMLTVDNVSIHLAAAGQQTAFDNGYVSLNFDDGWVSHYTAVRPMLNKAGMKGTFYIITNEMKNADPNQQTDLDAYLTADNLKSMQNDGHEISAHTRTHTSLVSLSSQQMDAEISGSRADLQSAGFSPVDTFAFPYGDYNDAVIQKVKDAGFIGARSVQDGYNTKQSNPYALKVQNVENTTSAAQIQSWVATAQQNKTWLTLVFHRVEANPGQYDTSPEVLQATVDYLQQHGVPVITAHEGLMKMKQ